MNDAQRKAVRATVHAGNELLKGDKAARALDLSEQLYSDAMGEKIDDLIDAATDLVELFDVELEDAS